MSEIDRLKKKVENLKIVLDLVDDCDKSVCFFCKYKSKVYGGGICTKCDRHYSNFEEREK